MSDLPIRELTADELALVGTESIADELERIGGDAGIPRRGLPAMRQIESMAHFHRVRTLALAFLTGVGVVVMAAYLAGAAT